MRQLGLVLILLMALPARADRISAAGFDAATTAKVYVAALEFIPPRALESVTIPELTLWGLGGLTALDPDLALDAPAGTVRLSTAGKILLRLVAPSPGDSVGWSAVAVALTEVAWRVSVPVRQAGTQGVIQSFFDSMLTHLDPYSRYIGPAEAAGEEERREGTAGAGMTFEAVRGQVVVASVVPDGPAGLAGVRPGDRILSVDGQSTAGVPADDVDDWLGGNDGTQVVVRIATGGTTGRTTGRTLTLTRMEVPEENVFSFRDGDNLLLRITSFNTRTAARLAMAIETGFATRHRPGGIILDLRGNRGGLLDQAAGATDEFLKAGIVATTRGRDPAADHVFVSRGLRVAPDLPLVVLVDGRTASAAEVMTAALADHSRAVVLGSSTLGKGLVQVVTRLPDGGELLLTWSRVLAPRGWPIQGLGVLPQVCTSMGESKTFRELASLREGIAPLADALARERAARAPVSAAETIAIRDACPAAEGTDLDLRAARALLAAPGAYSTALLPPVPRPAVTGSR